MEYLHASLILHAAGKQITEKALGEILTAAGLEPDKGRIKGLVAALGEINIEEALKAATAMPVAPTSAPVPSGKPAGGPATPAPAEPVQEEEEEEESGLSSLFG